MCDHADIACEQNGWDIVSEIAFREIEDECGSGGASKTALKIEK